MKIGILTFHKSINYGSVLQAWSLQEILRQHGYEAEIIDYEPDAYKTKYNLYLPASNIKNICKNILRIPVSRYRKHQIELFSEFREKELNISKNAYNSKLISRQLETEYDCIICGSDQIWNVHARDCDDFFFLPDIHTKKIAYAVSVNSTNFSEDRCNNEMKSWIKDFQFLSCREQAGADRIYKFIDNEKQVHTVLDPTLLHCKSDFDRIIAPRIINDNYIFLYKVWSGMDSFKMAASLGEKINMPVYTLLLVKDCYSLLKIEKKGIRVIKHKTSPKDYLSLINYASYVMTDSFHGTAFSIIFERPVICVKEKKPDGTEKTDERIENLLSFLGMEERYVSIEDICCFDVQKMTNYLAVTPKRMGKAKNDICHLISEIEA